MKLILNIIFLTISVMATPSLYGPTGLIEAPSAESVAYKQISVGIDYSMREINDPNSEQTYYYKFNFGTIENWELGILGGSF